MSQNKILPLFFLGFLLMLPLAGVRADSAPTATLAPKVALSCAPKNGSMDEKRTFTLTKGQPVDLVCTVINTTKEKLAGVLLVKQNIAGTSSASSAVVNLDGDEREQVALNFPQVFTPGNYYYTMVLMDKDGQALSPTTLLTGILVGEKNGLLLKEVTLDKNEYAWGDRASLSVTLNGNGNESSLLKLKAPTISVELLTKERTQCSLLLDKQSVTAAKADYVFTFSKGNHCINSLQVTLLDKDMHILDQKVMAVALPLQDKQVDANQFKNTFGQYLPSFARPMMLLAWLGAILLVFLGYTLWKHQRH